jgi:hypothetical protein
VKFPFKFIEYSSFVFVSKYKLKRNRCELQNEAENILFLIQQVQEFNWNLTVSHVLCNKGNDRMLIERRLKLNLALLSRCYSRDAEVWEAITNYLRLFLEANSHSSGWGIPVILWNHRAYSVAMNNPWDYFDCRLCDVHLGKMCQQ